MTRQPRALTGFKLVSGRCGQGTSAPADTLLAADADADADAEAGAFTALGGPATLFRPALTSQPVRRRHRCPPAAPDGARWGLDGQENPVNDHRALNTPMCAGLLKK